MGLNALLFTFRGLAFVRTQPMIVRRLGFRLIIFRYQVLRHRRVNAIRKASRCKGSETSESTSITRVQMSPLACSHVL